MKNNSLPRFLYRFAILPAGVGIAYILSPFHAKLRDTLKGRRGFRKRWLEKTKALKGQPVWFHVSSVGEYEQAKPVITEMKKRFPLVPVIVTFLSPSGLNYALRKEKPGEMDNITFFEYLPLDFSRNAEFCLVSARPRLLIFVKFDLWPNLIWKAREMGIPCILIDATLSRSSYRISRVGKWFYRNIYKDITEILAISHADADRFKASLTEHQVIKRCGDTRFDRVIQRKLNADRTIDFGGKTVIITGSTWPQDEERILPALAEVLRKTPDTAAIIAPHEPEKGRLNSIAQWARDHSLPYSYLSSVRGEVPDRIVIVDRVGVLAELYKSADIAYIGGSFSSGVHNVIEPAVMGIPVIFGPVHDNSLEAIELLEEGGAIEVVDSQSTLKAMNSLLSDSDLRKSMGRKAERYIKPRLGATEKCIEAIAGYIVT